MQNNRKNTKINAIKLASFSLVLLLVVWIVPQNKIPTQNEAVINVSDEIFKVQSGVQIENEEISFDGEEKTEENEEKTLLEQVENFFDELFN